MDGLDRSGLAPMPLNQSSRLPVPDIAHDRKMPDLVAVAEKRSLQLADPDRHVAQWFRIFVLGLFRRHIGNLSILPYGISFLTTRRLPFSFGHLQDRLSQFRCHPGTDTES